MNAHALLTSQGWRGTGHSLHKTDDAIGLAKPILVSRKDGNKGLGQKQHFTSDQWWMNAFDEQLKGLDTSKEGKVVQTVTTGKLNGIERSGLGKWALYASFVRGGFLKGTVSTPEETESSESNEASDAEPTTTEKKKETPEERRARKNGKRKRKEERALRRAARAERRAKKSKYAKSESPDTTDATDEEKRKRRAKKEEKRRKRKVEEKEKK